MRAAAAAVGMLLVAGTVAAEVRIDAGRVEGLTTSDGAIRIFKGIPYAAPPVGKLRWAPPQPVEPWEAVRKATEFGRQCVQGPIFSDIKFPTEASEDCLTLNIWTPAKDDGQRLPVMVWIHGGGFQAGAGAEPRHDGEALARKGVVLVTFNYRLGVFGFMAHPELTRESPNKASGNYGLLDMIAALKWVQKNIAAFGGDPGNVTIFGESAGSFAVSALMATPLARGTFHKAIGQSGAYFGRGALAPASLAKSEERGEQFAKSLGAASLDALRAKPATEVLAAALKTQPWFSPNIDGHVLPEDVAATFAAGKQSQVPLLAGWNADEIRGSVVLAKDRPNAKTFAEQARTRFGERAKDLLNVYPAGTDEEALESAAALASDLFIGYSTWKWIETHAATSDAPIYRYSFNRKIPVAPDTKINGVPATSRDIGARHAGEIEYVFGTLGSIRGVTWEEADRRLSDAMMTYWTNFARSGNPSGPGVPDWPRYDGPERLVQNLDVRIEAAPDPHRARYEFLDSHPPQSSAQ